MTLITHVKGNIHCSLDQLINNESNLEPQRKKKAVKCLLHALEWKNPAPMVSIFPWSIGCNKCCTIIGPAGSNVQDSMKREKEVIGKMAVP